MPNEIFSYSARGRKVLVHAFRQRCKIVLSSVPFNDRDACISVIRGLTQALLNRSNFEVTSEYGQSFFNVISEGIVAGTSPMYSSFSDANSAADSLRKDTSDEPQYSIYHS